MSTQDETTLIKLADSDVTIAAESIDVRGYPVRDKDGEEVGQVADLLIDPQERRVRFLLVTHGGFLGIGKTESFLPVDTITDITQTRSVPAHRARLYLAPPATIQRSFRICEVRMSRT